MALTEDFKKLRADPLVLVGGFVATLDTAWGAVASLGLDLSRTNELVLGVSFVLTLPAYLLDVWVDKRVAIFLLGLFIFRWVARCYGGPTIVLCSPWRGSVLLVVAFGLLQLSKLRKHDST